MMALALGFFLGFTGYLPPGNINLTVVQLALDNHKNRLWLFLSLAMLMEFIYCACCLMGLDLLLHQTQLIIILKWASVFIFTILGLLSFFHHEDSSKPKTGAGLQRGIFIVIANPLQIPFWLVWGVYLTDNKWISGNLLSTLLFAFITSIGTWCVLWMYAVGGKKVIEKLNLERKLIDRSIGLLLIGLALFQLYKLLHK